MSSKTNRSSPSPNKLQHGNIPKTNTNEEKDPAVWFHDFLMDMPPNFVKIPLRTLVNLQKGATFPFMLFLMYLYQNFSLGPFVYLALHGMYGILWVAKDFTIGDASFMTPVGFGTTVTTSILLLCYWYNGFALISGLAGLQNPSSERVAVAILAFLIGAVLMMGSDLQKNLILKTKKGLIDNGFFKYTRNPNYLGEIMIYGSFTIVTDNRIAWGIHIFVWSALFSLRMYVKELSLERKAGWDAYQKRSWILLPKLGGSTILSFLLYGILGALGYILYFDRELIISQVLMD